MSQDTFLINDLEKLTVPDLKSKLSTLGLSTTGRKSDLINRLKLSDINMNENLEKSALDFQGEKNNGQSDANEDKGEIIEQTTIVEESVTVSISEHDDQFLENGMNTMHTNEDDNKDIEAIDNEGDFDSYVKEMDESNLSAQNIKENEDSDNNDPHPTEKDIEGDEDKEIKTPSEKGNKERMDIHAYRRDAKRRTIHIRNLSDDLNADIKEYLKKSDHYTLRFSQEKPQTGKKIGSAELRFLTVEEAKEAIEKLKGQKIDDQEIEIRHSIDELEEKAREIDPKDLKTLYIGNLPASATKEMLTVIFKEAKEIDMPLDNTGKSKGHAYLEFENEDEANKALETYAGVSIDDGEATRQLKLLSAVESKREKHRSRSGSRDKSRSKRESRHRKDYGYNKSRYNRNYKKPYDHGGGNRYDSSRPGNRDVNSRGRYNNYRNWGPGGGSSSMVNPSMMQRVNPQAAMNLLMGVSQLLNHQQQQHNAPLMSTYSGGRNNYNKRRYEERGSGGGGGHYDRKMPRRGDGGGRHY